MGHAVIAVRYCIGWNNTQGVSQAVGETCPLWEKVTFWEPQQLHTVLWHEKLTNRCVQVSQASNYCLTPLSIKDKWGRTCQRTSAAASESKPVLEELQALCNNWVWSNEGNAKLGLLFARGQCKRVGFIVGKDARGVSLKWKNYIKHSICINYIVPLINIGTLRSSSSGGGAAGGIGLKAALQALLLEATIHAWGTLKLPVMSLNKWVWLYSEALCLDLWSYETSVTQVTHH